MVHCPGCKEPEGQLARWLEKLQEYHFDIVHRPGRKHANADSLSRRPCEQCGRIDQDQGLAVAVSLISIFSRRERVVPFLQVVWPEEDAEPKT